MKYRTKMSERAAVEINQSIDWYNEKKDGLGKRFYSKIKETIKFISKNPYTFELKYSVFRGATVKTFPFIVLYFIEKPDIIVIAAIFHTSKNPDNYPKNKQIP